MAKYSKLSNLNQAYRLVYPFSTILVSSTNGKDKMNVMAASWHTPLSFDPPMYGVAIGFTRFTYELIRETQQFVVNVCSIDMYRQVIEAGTISGRDYDKFKKIGLEYVSAAKVKPVRVKGCLSYLECILEKEVPVGDHAFMIGRVVYAEYNPDFFDNEGYPIVKKISPLYYGGNNVCCTIDNKNLKITDI